MHRLEQFIVEILLPPIDRLREIELEVLEDFPDPVGDLSESIERPNKSAVPEGEESAWRAETRAEIIEAFLWLHLGVEIGSFPEEATRAAYKAVLAPFFKSLLSRDDVVLDQLRFGERYVAHSPESQALVLALPRYASILVELAMREEEVFGKEQAGFDDPGGLRSLFQTLSLLYSSFVANPAVRQFTYELNFAEPHVWERDWKKNCTGNEAREADISGSGPPIALTLAGYLNFWGHGARCAELFQGLEGSEEVSTFDIGRLRNRFSELLRWRINLRSRDSTERFERIQEGLVQQLQRETKTLKVDPRGLALLQESMESAFELWGAVRV